MAYDGEGADSGREGLEPATGKSTFAFDRHIVAVGPKPPVEHASSPRCSFPRSGRSPHCAAKLGANVADADKAAARFPASYAFQ